MVRSRFSSPTVDEGGPGGTVEVWVLNRSSSREVAWGRIFGEALQKSLPVCGVNPVRLGVKDVPLVQGVCEIQSRCPQGLQEQVLLESAGAGPADQICNIEILEFRPYVPQHLSVRVTVTDRVLGAVLATTTASWDGEQFPLTSEEEVKGWALRRRRKVPLAGQELLRVSPQEFMKYAAQDLSGWLAQAMITPVILSEGSEVVGPEIPEVSQGVTGRSELIPVMPEFISPVPSAPVVPDLSL